MKLRGKCPDCKFFEEIEGQRGMGSCRFGPPVATVILVQTQNAIQRQASVAPQNFTAFPLMTQDDWCGQWARDIALAS